MGVLWPVYQTIQLPFFNVEHIRWPILDFIGLTEIKNIFWHVVAVQRIIKLFCRRSLNAGLDIAQVKWKIQLFSRFLFTSGFCSVFILSETPINSCTQFNRRREKPTNMSISINLAVILCVSHALTQWKNVIRFFILQKYFKYAKIFNPNSILFLNCFEVFAHYH